MKNTLTLSLALAFLAGAFLTAATSPAASSAAATGTAGAAKLPAAPATAAPTAIKIKPYLLDTCIVSGDKIGSMGTPIVVIQDNQEVKFCCSDCPKDFAKDPAKFMKLIAEAEKKLPAATAPAREPAVKPYPLAVCLIMNKPLGSMGAPLVYQYNGQEIKLCCSECVAGFDKNPLGLLQQITAASPKPVTAK